MPDYPHIERYYEDLRKLIEFGGSTNEQSIRPAFAYCLDAYCRDHRERIVLVPELAYSTHAVPDGTVKDALRMARGYWEAKDTHDDLDTEIQKKFNKGYPKNNIIFEDSQTAVLFQNGELAQRVDMRRPGELHRLIKAFLDYELPEIEDFRRAREQFVADLPTVLTNLRETVEDAEANSAAYQSAAADFLDLCRRTISPDVAAADVREMLLQHILTKDIFLRVFAEEEFHRENNVAQQLDTLERTFFTGDVRRNAIDRLRAYYGAVGRAADEIADYAEKQQFLKAIYEDFYKVYNPKAADRLGVVYTPNEIVDFMIKGTDHLLREHFGRGLADDNVQILDPATGTGTFITNLINYLPLDRLEHKYLNEMHANEVAILPYYIANLNIEYTFKERMGRYLEFPNLCFVDTLDNMSWRGASAAAVQRQGSLMLGAISEKNWERIRKQNDKTISVIIGNPPYNANQQNWNNKNKNIPYPEVDARIKATYIGASTAKKTKQLDMYKRFIRWASDRLADNGVIAFVSNRAFLDSRQDDGFRKVVADEFNELWVLDLKGDARTSGERRKKEGGNIFNNKIRVGVAIYFLVRKLNTTGFNIRYDAVDDYARSAEKIEYIKDKPLSAYEFKDLTPDGQHSWLHQTATGFESLLPTVTRETELTADSFGGQSVFGLSTPGINTARDEWVYDFSRENLHKKVVFFTDHYNGFMDDNDKSYNTIIKWSRDLRNEFERGRRIVFQQHEITSSLYRPYIAKYHFANHIANDVLTRNHNILFGSRLTEENSVINFCTNHKDFYALASNRPVDWHFTGDTQCIPRYRYTGEGKRVNNITEWGLQQFNDHYRKEWGKDFERIYPDGIGPDDVFAYTYAVLHDPVYRHDYATDLLQKFPRLPFYHDFDLWARMGRQLLDLHIGFESAEPYPLRRVRTGKKPGEPKLKVNQVSGVIELDGATRLTDVPEDAWRYRLGSRSALEWVLDQYRERKSKDPTIAEEFNTYRFADYKEQVIDLLRRVCTVSVKTMEVVDGMAYWDGDDLIVYGDRDKHEWAMMGLSQWAKEPEDPEWEAAWSET